MKPLERKAMKDLKTKFDESPDPLSIKEVSGLLRVHENTVNRWILNGQLDAIQPTGKWGSVRVTKEALGKKIFKD